jgi:hypothetical protein
VASPRILDSRFRGNDRETHGSTGARLHTRMKKQSQFKAKQSLSAAST